MDLYLMIKWVHVLSSTLLFGAGVASAFFLLLASLHGEPTTVAWVTGKVVWADWLFTATTVLVQPATGLYLVHASGGTILVPWISASIWLFLFVVACWLPVVLLQIRMRNLARDAAAAGVSLPPAYRRCFIAWVALGVPAFLAMLGIFYLMVATPS